MTKLVNATPHPVRIWIDSEGFELPRGNLIVRVSIRREQRVQPLRVELGGGEAIDVPCVAREMHTLEQVDYLTGEQGPFKPEIGYTYIVSAYVLLFAFLQGMDCRQFVAPQSNRAIKMGGQVQAVTGFVRAPVQGCENLPY